MYVNRSLSLEEATLENPVIEVEVEVCDLPADIREASLRRWCPPVGLFYYVWYAIVPHYRR